MRGLVSSGLVRLMVSSGTSASVSALASSTSVASELVALGASLHGGSSGTVGSETGRDASFAGAVVTLGRSDAAHAAKAWVPMAASDRSASLLVQSSVLTGFFTTHAVGNGGDGSERNNSRLHV